MALSIDDAIARLERLRHEAGGANARVIIEVLPADRHVLSPPRGSRAAGRAAPSSGSFDAGAGGFSDEEEPRRVSPQRHGGGGGGGGGRFEGVSPPQVTVSRGRAPTSPHRARPRGDAMEGGDREPGASHQGGGGAGGGGGVWAYSYQVPKDAFGALKSPEAGPIAEGDAIRREESVRRAERSPSRLGGTASPARRDGQATVGRLGAVPVFRYNPRDFEASAHHAASASSAVDRRLTSPPPPRGEARSVSPGRRGGSPGRISDGDGAPTVDSARPTIGRMDFAAVGHIGGWRGRHASDGLESGGAAPRIELRSVSPSRGGGGGHGGHGAAPDAVAGRGFPQPFLHHHAADRSDHASSRPATPRRAASAPRAATPRGKRRFPHVQSTIQRPPPVEQEPARMSSAFGGAPGGGGNGSSSRGFFAMNSAAPGNDARSISPRRRAASKGVAWVV